MLMLTVLAFVMVWAEDPARRNIGEDGARRTRMS